MTRRRFSFLYTRLDRMQRLFSASDVQRMSAVFVLHSVSAMFPPRLTGLVPVYLRAIADPALKLREACLLEIAVLLTVRVSLKITSRAASDIEDVRRSLPMLIVCKDPISVL